MPNALSDYLIANQHITLVVFYSTKSSLEGSYDGNVQFTSERMKIKMEFIFHVHAHEWNWMHWIGHIDGHIFVCVCVASTLDTHSFWQYLLEFISRSYFDYGDNDLRRFLSNENDDKERNKIK